MQVKNKLFPYPVINRNKILSCFENKNFRLIYDENETEHTYCMKNVHLDTDSELINELYNSGKVKTYCMIECSNTVYRKAFNVPKEGANITLYKADFSEKVDISLFAVAEESFTLYSNEFDDDYKGINFEIEKYDIIGADDGFNIRFKHEDSEENLVQSIFSIIVGHDMDDGAYIVECNTGRKIVVIMSENDYRNYKIIYTVPAYKEVFFNMLLVPALIEGLTLCRTFLIEDSSRDIDDLGNQYVWFRSILNAFKRVKGREITIENLKSESVSLIAQELLGKPLGKSLEKLVEETNSKLGVDENE
jgi:hypothetical protein